MDIIYVREIEKYCIDRKSAVCKWGPEQGKQIMRRIDDLRDVENLAQLRCFPACRPHALTMTGTAKFQLILKILTD